MKIKSFAAVFVAATSMVAPVSAATLSDVAPTNWAYSAIQSLNDKYGCLAGFPGGTFKPGQPATRAQVAALANACLDRVAEFSSVEDARTAAALRAEFSKELAQTNARVSALELAAATKANGVGNYLGAGILLNQQGVDGNGFSANKTIGGGNVQGRYVLGNAFGGQISARPYLNVVAGPDSQIGAAGGLLATYDYSIAKRVGVSAANVYGGAGYQVPFTQYTDANFQSAIGNRGQFVFVVGAEGRLSDSLTGYMDLKFPTTNAANSYGATNGTYSPVLSTGLAVKF
jgi:hypothetical protein